MEKVKLSIVIPHYNSPQSLSVLLDSIPDKEEIKVIVVDDNSTKFTDEYENVVKRYSNRNVTFLKNYTGKNCAGTCRNIGMEQAKGKWIMFADADDYYLDGWYDKVSKFFDSDNDIVFFAPTSVQLDTGKTDIRHIEIAKKIECSKEEIYCITRRKGSLTTIHEKNIEDIRLKNRIRRAAFLYDRLTHEEISLIGMDRLGMRVIYDGVKYGKGMVTYIKYLKKYRVPVFKVKYLNPFFVF